MNKLSAALVVPFQQAEGWLSAKVFPFDYHRFICSLRITYRLIAYCKKQYFWSVLYTFSFLLISRISRVNCETEILLGCGLRSANSWNAHFFLEGGGNISFPVPWKLQPRRKKHSECYYVWVDFCISVREYVHNLFTDCRNLIRQNHVTMIYLIKLRIPISGICSISSNLGVICYRSWSPSWTLVEITRSR